MTPALLRVTRFFPLVVVAISTLLSACVGSIYPRQPWTSRDELVRVGRQHAMPALSTEDARNMVIGLDEVLTNAERDRDLQALIGEEVAFYGTVVAVAGITTDSRAARNVGGVVAGLAALLTGHYKPTDQSAVFTKAAARADCLKEAMRPITPEVRAWFGPHLPDQPVDLATAYNKIPGQTIEFVDQISKALNASLKAVTLSAPTKDQLATTMKDWKAANSTKPPPVPDDARKNGIGMRNLLLNASAPVDEEISAFQVAVRDFQVNGAACLVQNAQ